MEDAFVDHFLVVQKDEFGAFSEEAGEGVGKGFGRFDAAVLKGEKRCSGVAFVEVFFNEILELGNFGTYENGGGVGICFIARVAQDGGVCEVVGVGARDDGNFVGVDVFVEGGEGLGVAVGLVAGVAGVSEVAAEGGTHKAVKRGSLHLGPLFQFDNDSLAFVFGVGAGEEEVDAFAGGGQRKFHTYTGIVGDAVVSHEHHVHVQQGVAPGFAFGGSYFSVELLRKTFGNNFVNASGADVQEEGLFGGFVDDHGVGSGRLIGRVRCILRRFRGPYLPGI